MKKTLTKKKIQFAKEYVALEDNGVKAVQKVFGTKNYDTAKTKASRLITNDIVKNHIERIKKSIADSIPDSLLIEKHKALLNKQEVITKNNISTGEIDVIPTGQIDVQAVSKGLDMAYKLKKVYEPESGGGSNMVVNVISFRAYRD